MSTKEAWREVVQYIAARPERQAAYPVKSLVKSLADYFVFTASSSGVEQSFSVTHWGIDARRRRMSPLVEESTTTLLTDTSNRSELCALTRRCWVKVFGKPRFSGFGKKPRIDTGIKRRRAPADKTTGNEIGFLRARRRASSAVAVPAATVPTDQLPEGWTDEHAKELEFTRKKLRRREAEACFENLLLPHEKRDGLNDEVTQMTAALHKGEQARARKRKGQKARVEGGVVDYSWLANKTIFVSARVGSPLPSAFVAACRRLHMTSVKLLHDADCIVSSSLEEIGQRVRWVSLLRGSYIMTPKSLTHGAASLKLKPAAATQRRVWMSATFKEHHKPTAVLLMSVIRSLGAKSRWSWVESKADFLAAKRKDKHGKVVALVADNERRSDMEHTTLCGTAH